MKIHPGRSRFLLLCALVIAGILAGLLVLSPAQADVGVHPILPGGSNIEPEGETPIQMAAETVTIDVRAATVADNSLVKLNADFYGFNYRNIWYEVVAEVKADFTMKNPASDDVSMIVWFPLASALENVTWNFNPGEIVPAIQQFKVSVGGNPIDYQVSEQPNPKGTDKPLLPWASFPVTFPGGRDTSIHVSYTVPLSPSAKGYEVALYYIFQTGAGWAGPIGQAELILNLPYPPSNETLADNPKISLPYGGMGQISTGIPAGTKVNGNQARWTWQNFEPGAADDFAVWLLKPKKWEELRAARSAVQLMPADGLLWLNLAYEYHFLSTYFMVNAPTLFSSFYLPQAIEAYQKAEALLPDHPVPHIGLGMLNLQTYYKNVKSAQDSVIRNAQQELYTARMLETKNPTLEQGSPFTSWDLENALSPYFYNDATATADKATLNAMFARDTEQATIEYLTRTIWASGKQTSLACRATPGADCTGKASPTPTATFEPTSTATPSPTLTPRPSPTATPPVPPEKGYDLGVAAIVVTGVVLLVVAIYLIWKRYGIKR